jgi:hypothetical protein
VKTGKVEGKTAKRHTSAGFNASLEHVVQARPRAREAHLVLDSLSVHKTKAAAKFLERHPKRSRKASAAREGRLT